MWLLTQQLFDGKKNGFRGSFQAPLTHLQEEERPGGTQVLERGIDMDEGDKKITLENVKLAYPSYHRVRPSDIKPMRTQQPILPTILGVTFSQKKD